MINITKEDKRKISDFFTVNNKIDIKTNFWKS